MAALASADLLRLATAGSVDDGKSTLIGRLLFDSKQVLTDQLEHVEEASRRRGAGMVDLSLLVDGLRAEREQGITIDVAYRYFATTKRTFIIADTPGHVQYTRNMVTGASTADLAVILVDARKGLLEQSKRHAYISSLLGIPHLVVAVNKMDLVEFDEEVFDAIVREFSEFARGLGGVRDIVYVPISAKLGDNVVERSEQMPWYGGTPLLEHLESVHVADARNLDDARLPVQWVIRDHETDYRGYAGQLAGGVLRAGDDVLVLPSRQTTTIARIDTYEGPLEEAVAGMSVTLLLADELDVSRGDIICHATSAPELSRELDATICWMADAPLRVGARYAIKHATHGARAIVDEVVDRVDVHTLAPDDGATELALNDIGRVRLRTSTPMAFDPYARNRATGSFILIDESSNDTVGAGMIR
ncbi:MAG TPA: GTP-binding protein [Solirubrobacteraceae bacterium]|nr:GTP-binding protein [Solirubrobacteraceae bacterium]